MSWICQCSAPNTDDDRFCIQCGQPFQQAAPPPAMEPVIPAIEPGRASPQQPGFVPGAMPFSKPPGNGLAWKLGVVASVLVLGGIFGSVLAVMVFGHGTTARANPNPAPEPKTAFQESFDTSFKSSCRDAAMRSGKISQAAADRYCDCALNVFHQTHSPANIIQSCRQQLVQ